MAFSTNDADDDLVSDINITPLVDVMLVLMITFIITAPLLNNAVHVNLPQTAATSPADQSKAVTLSVDEQGKVFIDKREIKIADVQAELEKDHRENPDLALNLQADKGTAYGVVAKVMAFVERAGITRLSVLTDQE
ncbi:ExbD/TolR family protein [Caballeronia sordidicola]|uniref:Biopolymer transport protein ExbD/TolR n=1 Tax=Caballeronia sordidicola TaxID=196367 RepID=A0A242M9E6_CABSO|nr:biopolymer transporter ExbD [Caballeronia sordidicola]OTP67785.1 Biopolymer transport protein ExbD/TolR [Caballeronia sordidicola]